MAEEERAERERERTMLVVRQAEIIGAFLDRRPLSSNSSGVTILPTNVVSAG